MFNQHFYFFKYFLNKKKYIFELLYITFKLFIIQKKKFFSIIISTNLAKC